MRDLLGPGTIAGYCTNVHPSRNYPELLENLRRFTLPIKTKTCPDEPMGVGLWLSASLAKQLNAHDELLVELVDFFNRHGLILYTLNGFPYGNFHGNRVKHNVYEPAWDDRWRVDYTVDLIEILFRVLRMEGSWFSEGSISTLPVGWAGNRSNELWQPAGKVPLGPWERAKRPGQMPTSEDLQAIKPGPNPTGLSLDRTRPIDMNQAAENLAEVATYLAWLEQEFEVLIHLDLEPEPGCVLQTSRDVVRFFENDLDRIGDSEFNHRHIRVCYDACHGAVMFEDPKQALENYRHAEIKVGKVQISSAIHVPMDQLSKSDQTIALEQLARFAEDRYLHQTVICDGRNGHAKHLFFEDLPHALEAHRNGLAMSDPWRVHFHLPLFVDRFGLMQTTQHQLVEALRLLRKANDVSHYEVETYAWDVLPVCLRKTELDEGIAKEINWLRQITTRDNDQQG